MVCVLCVRSAGLWLCRYCGLGFFRRLRLRSLSFFVCVAVEVARFLLGDAEVGEVGGFVVERAWCVNRARFVRWDVFSKLELGAEGELYFLLSRDADAPPGLILKIIQIMSTLFFAMLRYTSPPKNASSLYIFLGINFALTYPTYHPSTSHPHHHPSQDLVSNRFPLETAWQAQNCGGGHV